MKKLLNVGVAMSTTPEDISKDYQVLTMDIDPQWQPDYLQDITEPFPPDCYRAFDIVYCSHTLEHIDRIKVPQTVTNLCEAVSNGGLLYLKVPSLEWVAEEVLNGRDDRMEVYGALFGGQHNPYDYHRHAFTIRILAALLGENNFTVVKSYRDVFTLRHENGDWLKAIQNVVVAKRISEVGHAPKKKNTSRNKAVPA